MRDRAQGGNNKVAWGSWVSEAQGFREKEWLVGTRRDGDSHSLWRRKRIGAEAGLDRRRCRHEDLCSQPPPCSLDAVAAVLPKRARVENATNSIEPFRVFWKLQCGGLLEGSGLPSLIDGPSPREVARRQITQVVSAKRLPQAPRVRLFPSATSRAQLRSASALSCGDESSMSMHWR